MIFPTAPAIRSLDLLSVASPKNSIEQNVGWPVKYMIAYPANELMNEFNTRYV